MIETIKKLVQSNPGVRVVIAAGLEERASVV